MPPPWNKAVTEATALGGWVLPHSKPVINAVSQRRLSHSAVLNLCKLSSGPRVKRRQRERWRNGHIAIGTAQAFPPVGN